MNGTVVNFYCGSVVYTGSKAVEYVEGIAHKSGSGFSYQYNQTDHLGNVRSVADASKTVVQATDYFPFGLAHSTSNFAKNKYLYNGKELQNDVVGGTPFGQLDYGARMYDATLGVWHSIDLLAEKHHGMSPYEHELDSMGRMVLYLMSYVNSYYNHPKDINSLIHAFDRLQKDEENSFYESYRLTYKFMEKYKNRLYNF